MSAGSRDPALGEEGLDGLGAEALDVEGAAGDEVAELLDGLGRADQVAGAVVHRLAGLADHVGAADRAGLGEGVGDAVGGAAGEVDVLDLRDDVAGAVDRHPVADADVAAVADRVAPGVAAGDVVGVVQGGVLDDDAADGDGQQAGDRREGAGAADLDVDRLEAGRGALGGELVGERPARGGGAEAEAGLQVEAVELVDDAVDVVAERRALGLDQAVVGEHLRGRCRSAASAGWSGSRGRRGGRWRRTGCRPAARRSRPRRRRRSAAGGRR